jgi:hypothetical protein
LRILDSRPSAEGSTVYDPVASPPHPRSSRISAELKRLAPQYEFSVADNVVFTRGLISAAVDHVVVDRWGVLIIDAELHEGASILGTDTDTKWTATFQGGQVTEFRNPLYLNTGNENLVKQALADAGVSLEPNEIRSAVVFAGADISRLSLVEVTAAKVKSVERVAEVFEARRTFPPNAGRLTGADIDRIMTMVAERAQNPYFDEDETAGPWQADPAVVVSTQAALSVPPPTTRLENSGPRTLELAGHHTGPADGPSLRSALLTLGTIVVIILTVVAGIVFYPQLQAGSTVAWTAALVLAVALAELVAANIAAAPRNAGKPRPGGTAGGVVRFVLRLLLVFVLIAAGWAFVAGGISERLGERLVAGFGPDDTVGSSAATPPSPGLIAAKKRLREKAPQVYKNVSNLNSPSVYEGVGGKTSYTWTYTPKNASEPASFTLTIDTDGKIVSP